MRLHICAVGRMRSGPEKILTDDYLERFEKAGRQFGLGPVHMHEVEDKKNLGPAGEAPLLQRVIPDGARVVALDERGKVMSSPKFAQVLADWRDDGCGDLAFVIGGADGLDPMLRKRADMMLSFGAMVWPHMLIRAMLAEQIYRAGQIIAGTPYHRV